MNVGQNTVPPEIIAAARDAAPGQAGEVLRELAEAAAIMAASSAVPVFGTAGGAIVVAVKILGPHVFRGITGLLKGRENPWPGRIDRVMRSNVSPDEKYLALWALQTVAATKQTGGDGSTRRWARGAVVRIDAAIRSLWPMLSEQAKASAMARVPAPGDEAFRRMPLDQLARAIEATRYNLGPGWGAFKAQHAEADPNAIRAQLGRMEEVYRARQVPPMPPAPPPAPPPPPMPPEHARIAAEAQQLFQAWAAANPSQAACLTPGEANHVQILYFRAHALRELSIADATAQIAATIRAACARSGIAAAGGWHTPDGYPPLWNCVQRGEAFDRAHAGVEAHTCCGVEIDRPRHVSARSTWQRGVRILSA